MEEQDFSLVDEVVETQSVNVLIRISPGERERWKSAAGELGLSMSELVRETVSGRVSEVLDCQHLERRVYPWAEFCLRCGLRLRG